MRISVIFTGGTIGSRTQNGPTDIDAAAKYTLLEPFKADGLCFEPVEPYSILSENLSANELNRLQGTVRDVLRTTPDGIIVTHGTDTLHYTAAALALAFADADVPIVLVSAAYPLAHPQTNGFANFEGALTFIRHSGQTGVFVSYRNSGTDEVTVHHALRLLQHSEGGADLFSLGEPAARCKGDALLTACPVDGPTAALGTVTYTDAAPILVIDSVPGGRYAYTLDGVRAVLLKPYHSATLNTDSEALRAFGRRAFEAGIPVYVSGVKSGPAYQSTARFDELHIRKAPYSTAIALYMKLWAAASLDRDIDAVVNSPVACEWL